MLYTEYIAIDKIAIHFVGNKLCDDGCNMSSCLTHVDDIDRILLFRYFLAPFTKTTVYHSLFHEADMRLNMVYACVSHIFDNPAALLEQSMSLARHLYDYTCHPKIKGGELYVVYFKDCIIEGETVDAVGLFKSERTESFLKVNPSGGGFEIKSQRGINIDKLDKGCLIFNTDRENGYVVAVAGNISNQMDGKYWLSDFLHIRQRWDDYYHTQNLMLMMKSFVTHELPDTFEVSKVDQVDLLNQTVDFFKEKETFDMEEFANEVFVQPTVVDKFNRFREGYTQDRDIVIPESFTISSDAVRRQARTFKSLIKLDKNFHIYIHGDRNLIEQGEDDRGKFYKTYFTNEL